MTTRIIIISFLLPLFSCQTETKNAFVLPDNKDIDSICSVILRQEKLDLIKEFKRELKDTAEINRLLNKKISRPISVDLKFLHVNNDWQTNDTNRVPPPPPGFGTINLSDLMNHDIKENKLFNTSDTAFIFFQSQNLKQYKLTFIDSTKFILTSYAIQEKKRKADEHVSYCDLSIPIFSGDKNSAYVELTNNCTGLCGSASFYVLKKINGHWTVIDTGMLWIS